MANVERRVPGLAIDLQTSRALPGWGASLAGLFVALALIAAFFAVGLGFPAQLPLQAASWLTFLAVVIAPGYLIGETVTWRLDLDLLERLALAMPLGVAVMAVPGLVAMLGHLTVEDLAVGWTVTVGAVIAVWFVHRLLLRRDSQRSVCPPWRWSDVFMFLLLAAAFVYVFPTLSLYKMDGDAYAVATFTSDALTGRPLNMSEPILGTGRSMGTIRMGMNQLLPVFHLWAYFSEVDHIELLGTASRSMLALWAILAAYMLGKAAGGGSRRVGFLTASIQMLVYMAAPFIRADHVGIFFFERTNADKFTVTVTMLPVVAALAIRYVGSGRHGPRIARATWLAAALAGFAVSSIHALIAAMLALALGAFGALHLLLNLRRKEAWIHVLALALLTVIVMVMPLIQLFEASDGVAMAPTYPSSLEGWSVEERPVPVLPSVLASKFPTVFPSAQMHGLDVYGPLPNLAYLDAQQANTTTNPFLIWRFALNMRRQRIIVFDLHRYISNPTLILEPVYILALLLLPLLLWRLPSDPGAQYCLSTSLAVLFVLFNPVLTPILGSLVMPWILWRFVWLLPYALIIALVVDRSLKALTWPLTRWSRSKPVRGELLAAGALALVVLAGFLLRYNIEANLEEMQARGAAPLVYATPDKILARLKRETAAIGPVMVMADGDLSVTIPAFAGNADVVAHRILSTAELLPADKQDEALQRHIDQYRFLSTPLLTPEHLDILERYDVRYVVVPSGTSLEAQLRLSPTVFEWQVADDGYSLYAVGESSEIGESILGNAAFLERNWDAALGHYRNALEQDPGAAGLSKGGSTPDVLAYLGLAGIYRVNGEFDQALATLREALALVEGDAEFKDLAAPVLHYRLGQVYADMGQVEQSIHEFDLAQAGDPSVFAYHMDLGDTCLSTGHSECAQTQFRAAVESLGLEDKAQRLTMLGSIWQQRADTATALSFYEEAAAAGPGEQIQLGLADMYRNAEDYDRAETLLLDLYRKYPLWVKPDAHLRILAAMARLEVDRGRIDEAIGLFERVIWLQEQMAQDTRSMRLMLAQTLVDAGTGEDGDTSHLERARAEVEEVLRLQPHSAAAYILLGNLYRAQYEPRLAMEAFRYALRLDPTEAAAYTSLSDQYRQQAASPDETLALMQSAVEFNPEQALLTVSLADQYRRIGDVDLAITTYQQALGWFDGGSAAASPGSQSAPQPTGRIRSLVYSRLAALYEDLGQIDTAMNYYQAVVTAAPEQPWTWVTLGDGLRRRGMVSEAEETYRTAIEKDPAQVDGYLRLASLMSDGGNYTAAAELFDQGLQAALSGTNPAQTSRAWLALGGYYSRSPQIDLDQESDEDLFVETDPVDLVTERALAAYHQALEAEESVAGVRALARLYQDLGQPGEAIELFQGRIEEGERARWVPSLLAQYHVGLGDAYLDALQPEEALAAYTQAVELDGWWSGARLALARGYAELGQQGWALAEIQRAAEIAPGSVDAQLALARAFDEQGEREQALALYQASAAAHPGSAPANLALARAWQDRFRWDLAEQSYNQAMNMVPGETEAYLGLASLYAERARFDEAEAMLGKALTTDRVSLEAYLQLGALLARQARYAEALDAYGHALRISEAQRNPGEDSPSIIAAYAGLADIQRAQGEFDLAEQNLRAMVEINRVSGNTGAAAGVLIQLAGFYGEQNRPDQAEQALVEALELVPADGANVDGAVEGQSDLPPARLRASLALAEFYQSMGRGNDALEVLRLALEENPDSILALVSYAGQLRLMGLVEEADLAYRQAEEVGEGSGAGYLALAATLQAQGREADALALVDKALGANPRDASGWSQKGQLQMQLDQQAGALEIQETAPDWLEALNQATELAPAQGWTWSALGSTLLAAMTGNGGQGTEIRGTTVWEMGTSALQRAIATEPTYLPAYGALVDAYRPPAPSDSDQPNIEMAKEAAGVAHLAQLAVPGSHLGYLYEARVYEDLQQLDKAAEALGRAVELAPGLPEAYVALGRLEHQQGNIGGAEEWYRKAADLRPGEQAAYLNLVDLLLSQADDVEALETAQKGVTHRPGDSALLLRLGQVQRLLGQYAEAEAALQKAARMDPASDRILAELAMVYEAEGKLEKAITTYDQAISLNPEPEAYYLALGRLWSARGRPEHALTLLRNALAVVARPVPVYVAISELHLRRGEPRLAQEVLEEGIDAFGGDIQLHQALGAYLQSQAEFAQAEDAYRQAASTLTEEDATGASQARLALGGFLLARGRIEEAVAEYEQAVIFGNEENPDGQARAQLALGSAYQLMRLPDQAISAYNRATELAPRLEEAYIQLAAVYQGQAKWAEAQKTLSHGLLAAPASTRLMLALSDLLVQRGDDESALDFVSRAVQLSPGARTHMARAALYRRLGQPAEAIRDLEMARQIEPGSAEVLVALGDLQRSQGDVAGAREAYRLALSMAPGVAAPYMALADLALDQGQLDEVRWQLEGARVAEPSSPAPLLALAAAHSVQNEWEEAESVYRQAMDLAPTSAAPYIGLAELAQLRTGSAEEALAWLSKAESLDQNQATVLGSIARICQNAPDTDGCQPGLAVEALKQAVQLEPARPEGNLGLAEFYLAQGLPNEARNYVVRALEIAPGDPAVQIAQGSVHQMLGEDAEAEASYRAALGLDATRVDGYRALAQFYVTREDQAKAVAVYQDAIRTFPLDSALWVSLGGLYLEMEEYASALSAFEQAAQMNPSSPEPWLGQGDVQVAKEKWEAAQKAYEQAQRLAPQQAEPLLRLSGLAEQQDKMGNATDYASKAIEVDPNSAPGYATLGRMLQEGDKMAEAADALLKAVQLDARQHAAYNRWMWSYTDIQRQPYNVDRSRLKAELAKIAEGNQAETVWAQILLGLGYLTLEEEIEQAIEHLEKAAAMDPAYMDLYRDLALANEAARDGPKALEWWQRYLYAAGQAADLRDTQKQIENLKLVQIEEPKAGAKVSGKVEIVGTAKGRLVVSYKLEVRPVGTETWSTIATGTDRVTSGTLGIWDTDGLSPGEYQLRLDVVRSDEDTRPYHLITVEVVP